MLYWPDMLSLPLSRYFVSLKAYMLLRAYGKDKYRRLIQQNLDQIDYLEKLVRAEGCLEITAPLVSNVVCFRYNPGGFDESRLEMINKAIMGELWKIHFGVVSDTTVKGRYTLRACCTNHRTKYKDFDWLVNEVKKQGYKMTNTLNR